MYLDRMSREQWFKTFDRWYRHVFNIGMHADGPPHELIEECFSMGVSPAEAVEKLKNQGFGDCCSG